MAVVTDNEINTQIQAIRTEAANYGITKEEVASAYQDIFDTLNSRIQAKRNKVNDYAFYPYNLNAFTIPGDFRLTIQELSGGPDGLNGSYTGLAFLEVYKSEDLTDTFFGYIFQRFTTIENIYIRYNDTSSWSPWKKAGDELFEILTITSNGQTSFNLSNIPASPTQAKLFINGQMLDYSIDFNIVGVVLTYLSTDYNLQTSDNFKIYYK